MKLNWELVGNNVRRNRILSGYTQEELAVRAAVTVSTIYNAERGRPLLRRSLEKICRGLECPLDSVVAQPRTHLTHDADLRLHRAEDEVWIAMGDRRAKIPEGDLARIQQPEERLRLGRLGLVTLFVCHLRFIMPEGPGPVQLELYGRFDGALNHMLYRDSLLRCEGGTAQVEIASQRERLERGDGMATGARIFDGWRRAVPSFRRAFSGSERCA